MNVSVIANITLATVFCCACFFNLLIYLYNRSDKRFLYFALFCLSFSFTCIIEIEYIHDYLGSISPNLQLFCFLFFATLQMHFIICIYTSLCKITFNAKSLYFSLIIPLTISLMSLLFPKQYGILFFWLIIAIIYLTYFYCFHLIRHCTYITKIEKFITQVTLFFLFTGILHLSITKLITDRYSLNALILLTSMYILTNTFLFSYTHALSIKTISELSQSIEDSIEKVKNNDTAYRSTQMQPQFLYNSLDMISNTCMTEPELAEDLIIALSKYLQQTLDFEQLSGTIKLSKELGAIRAYSLIQMNQYPNISITYSIPTAYTDIIIPPLTLLPLIENAVLYASVARDKALNINLSCSIFEGYALFEVSDDGCGIPQEVVDKISEQAHGNARIGLYSINARLISLYGKGLSIQTLKDVGTNISFMIPFTRLEDAL